MNGTRIVGTYLLGHGDVMRLDEEELRFEIEGVSAAQPASEAAPTALLDVSSLRAEYASADRRELPPPAANLEVVRGHFAGATFAIDRPVCAIGRGPQSDVRIRDDSVSMNHASLLRKGTSWFVVDLRSANGTFVDGSRVAGERELVTGSRLRIGAVELTFRALDFGEAPVEQKPRRSLMRRLSTAVRQVAAGRQGA